MLPLGRLASQANLLYNNRLNLLKYGLTEHLQVSRLETKMYI